MVLYGTVPIAFVIDSVTFYDFIMDMMLVPHETFNEFKMYCDNFKGNLIEDIPEEDDRNYNILLQEINTQSLNIEFYWVLAKDGLYGYSIDRLKSRILRKSYIPSDYFRTYYSKVHRDGSFEEFIKRSYQISLWLFLSIEIIPGNIGKNELFFYITTLDASSLNVIYHVESNLPVNHPDCMRGSFQIKFGNNDLISQFPNENTNLAN